jgi:thiosulfate/3-mercaptopyruvate sulfurtransferase
MKQQLLLSVQDLYSVLKTESCLVVDCRFVLSNPAAGHLSYLEAHIPGAVYAHLDNDLSGPVTTDSGRHPLPDLTRFAAFLASSGWQPGTMLVAYDDAGGSIAARLWWLMKYFGHDCVALLDGGLPAWQSAGYELESGPVAVACEAPVTLCERNELLASTREILKNLEKQHCLLVDVRAAERFRGDVEPIDSVAGHIPGSVNYPFQLNLLADGRFKSAPEIRTGLLAMSENRSAQDVVFMCGSGVTACHTIFAAELAGLEGSKLYAGSWSEWIRDPSHPVEPV